jgi:Mrp family chromosome partitioning ATPase
VRWGKTREDALWEAASRLRLNHAPLMGTVINLVEPRIQAKHGYGGALKYRQQARSYIAD